MKMNLAKSSCEAFRGSGNRALFKAILQVKAQLAQNISFHELVIPGNKLLCIFCSVFIPAVFISKYPIY